MPTIDNWRALREALDAGPTEGPWISAGPSFGGPFPEYCNEVVIDREGDDEDGETICDAPLGLESAATATMNYIAAAHPAAIRSLLDERDRLAAEVEALRADAGRYRWLRAQNWNDGLLAVVADPKEAVKLGYDCPSLFRLDEQIDAALLEQQAIDAAMKGKP